jgi:hypothetical protein
VLHLYRSGAVVVTIVVGAFVGVGVAAVVATPVDNLNLGIRLASLWGLLAMACALLLAPFLADIRRLLGQPFLRIHHLFAAIGIASITLHPVLVAVRASSMAVFIPSTGGSVTGFLFGAGRIALPLCYIGIVGALLRNRVPEWRYIHLLLYAALLLGLVHGWLQSRAFFGIELLAGLYLALGIAIPCAFVLKRWQRYRVRRRSARET